MNELKKLSRKYDRLEREYNATSPKAVVKREYLKKQGVKVLTRMYAIAPHLADINGIPR